MNNGAVMADLGNVDLNLLLLFQHLLEDRNISAVARRMDLSQPAVSNALRRLRVAFGDELFVRTGQGMLPTPRAQRLAGPVSEALAMLSQAIQERDSFEAAHSQRRFRVAMTDVGEIHFMPRLMEVCATVAPGVRIDSVRVLGTDLAREMEAGRVDIAIGAFDEMGAGSLQRMLFRQGYATLFRQGHPTAQAGMGIKAFRAERHLIVSRAAPYGQVNQSMERAGVMLAEHFSVPHFAAVPYIVSATDLLATVPEKLAASAAPRFDLQVMVPPLRVPALQTNMYWQRRFDRDGGNQWLRAVIVDTFSETA